MRFGFSNGRTYGGFIRRIVAYEFDHTALFVGGVFRSWLEAGGHWVWGRDVLTLTVDCRERHRVIPLQELVTKDGAGVRVSAMGTYAIADPELWLLRHEDSEAQLHASLQLAVRDAVSARTLVECVEARADLTRDAEASARPRVAALGGQLRTLEMRDLVLLGDLRRAYAATLAAELDARAALERARGEAATLRSLANTARMLESNPNLYALRVIHAVEAAKDAKIVLPAPSSPSAT